MEGTCDDRPCVGSGSGSRASGAIVRKPTTERRQGKLTGHNAADCIVTISKIDGVESLRTISDVSPPVPDGSYKLIVEGERSASRWRKDKNGWSALA